MLRKVLAFGFVLSIHALAEEGDLSGSSLKSLVRGERHGCRPREGNLREIQPLTTFAESIISTIGC
jgi:hypothetical protein